MTKAEEIRAQKARAAIWRRPCLDRVGSQLLVNRATEIAESCEETLYYLEEDAEEFLAIFDGDEDMAEEYKIAFGELYDAITQFLESVSFDWDDYDAFTREILCCSPEDYDDASTVMYGGRDLPILGYDNYEQDWFPVGDMEGMAIKTARDRLMRKTKAQLLELFRKSGQFVLQFLEIEQRYQALRGTIDIMFGDTEAVKQAMEELNTIYEKAQEIGWGECVRRFDRIAAALPDRCWVI